MLRIGLMSIAILAGTAGCAIAPKLEGRPAFKERSRDTTDWFRRSVVGLDEQLAHSGGYVIFPEPVQWGMLLSGGTYGRGAVCKPDGSQIGWACISTGSIGLQAGIQKFRMLVVFENQKMLREFQHGRLFGSASGVAVAAHRGKSKRASFKNGVVVYEGSNEGLMAGVSVALNLIRYEPEQRGDEPPAPQPRAESKRSVGPMAEVN